MDEIEFNKIYRKAHIEVIDTFNKSTLKRTLSSKTALKHLAQYEKNIKKILNNPNLSQAQFLEINNLVNRLETDYKNKVTTKNKIISKEKSKVFKKQIQDQLKKEFPKVTTVKQDLKADLKTQKVTATINPNISDASKGALTGLINNAAKVAGVESPLKSTITSLSIPDQPNRINWNLKGFALIKDIAMVSVRHGQQDVDVDRAIKEKKISASEGKNIKTFINSKGIKSKITQIQDLEKARQFYSPNFQQAFNMYLQNQYNNNFTKIPKDITPPKTGGGSSSKSGTNFIDKFTKKLKSVMKTGASMGAIPAGGGGKTPLQEALGMYDPFNKPGPYMNKGGRVPSKRKPYAMGGKVYSNQTRKPKFK